MNLEKARNASIFLAGILLAVGAIKSQLPEHLEAFAVYFDFVVLAGLLLLVVATTLHVFLLIPPPKEVTYFCRPVAISELDSIYEKIMRMMGNDIADRNLLEYWLGIDPHVLYVVERKSKGALQFKSEIVGFFSVFRVTTKAMELLEQNILKGTNFTDQHIAQKSETAAALYIGAVGASGFRARAATLNQLIGHVNAKIEDIKVARKWHSVKIFVRPISQVGNRLVNKYSFEKCVSEMSSKTQIQNYRRSV
jgi:hypothetical protein